MFKIGIVTICVMFIDRIRLVNASKCFAQCLLLSKWRSKECLLLLWLLLPMAKVNRHGEWQKAWNLTKYLKSTMVPGLLDLVPFYRKYLVPWTFALWFYPEKRACVKSSLTLTPNFFLKCGIFIHILSAQMWMLHLTQPADHETSFPSLLPHKNHPLWNIFLTFYKTRH